MSNTWYLIINPTSGKGSTKKIWRSITSILNKKNIKFDFAFTEYEKHSIKLIEEALIKGYRKFICVGGDGTIHNITNGIMLQNIVDNKEIKVGIIPIGTGNDWIKTYNISKNIKKAIAIILKEKTVAQDIGLIKIENTNKEVFFNNLAGIGFDGYVVNKVDKLKKYGFIAYLLGGIIGLFSYKKSFLKVSFNKENYESKALMILVGLCKFSGGGMQLTKDVDTSDGLFDITIAKDFSLLKLLVNIPNLFNGKIVKNKLVSTYKTNKLSVSVLDKSEPFIQADGELIGSGNFEVLICKQGINFIVN